MEGLAFKGPFPEKAVLSLSVPEGLKDDDGRALANAAQFPLAIRTDAMPPLAKFSSSFGVLEAADPVLPVSLRNLENRGGRSRARPAWENGVVREGDDAMVIGWLKYLDSVRYGRTIPNVNPKKPPVRAGGKQLFRAGAGPAKPAEFAVPKPNGSKAFEVVGIPLAGPGFYVVELASPRPGRGLSRRRDAVLHAYRRAGHQPGRACQDRSRIVAGLGDGARQRPARGRCPGGGARLRRQGGLGRLNRRTGPGVLRYCHSKFFVEIPD